MGLLLFMFIITGNYEKKELEYENICKKDYSQFSQRKKFNYVLCCREDRRLCSIEEIKEILGE